MNITVITPFDSANYGAFLQAYCLKMQLESWGHSVFHALTRDEVYVRNLFYHERTSSKKDKLLYKRFLDKKKFGMEKFSVFKEDQKFFRIADASHKSDLYVLGSDEVWNINHPAFRKRLFWGGDMSPVISYAASIGGASFDDLHRYPQMINDLRRLDTALVRDERTMTYLKSVAPGTNAAIVCDPTMLIDVDSYGKAYSDPYIEQNDCLLIYAYSLKKDEAKAIKEYAASHHLKTVSCCFYHRWTDYSCMCSPLQFSSLIRKCKAVITTTFHGSIFSILNHAEFISLPISPKTNQLLEQFGLSDRLLNKDALTPEALDSVFSKKISYDEVDKRLQNIREKSQQLLKSAIDAATAPDKEDRFDYQICPADSCTGCFACMNKCPKNAINVVTDVCGRTLPLIDAGACIKCGMCKKVCPENHPVELRACKACYAAQRPDEDQRKLSASGGIGAVLTEYYIENGGVVYGAVVDQDAVVRHRRIVTAEDAAKLRGSKYVQSFTGDSYQSVQKDLKAGLKVLYIGTPCQIAGLYRFLGKEYDNLTAVDIICHGVPPMEYLSRYIAEVVPDKKVDSFSFRGGDRDFVLKAFSDNELVFSKYKDADPYYRSFMELLSMRENCYQCRYAGHDRAGDLTIGDFWGIDRNTLTSGQTGKISVIVVNSEKGSECFDQIRDRLVIEERKYDEAVQGNPQLRRPSIKHKDRERFLLSYTTSGSFSRSVNLTSIRKEIEQYERSKTFFRRGVRAVKRRVGFLR